MTYQRLVKGYELGLVCREKELVMYRILNTTFSRRSVPQSGVLAE